MIYSYLTVEDIDYIHRENYITKKDHKYKYIKFY